MKKKKETGSTKRNKGIKRNSGLLAQGDKGDSVQGDGVR